MANPVNVAIAGATGAVGVEMLLTLEKRNFPVKNLKLLASARSVGKTFKFHGETVAVEEMTDDSFKGKHISDCIRGLQETTGGGWRFFKPNQPNELFWFNYEQDPAIIKELYY